MNIPFRSRSILAGCALITTLLPYAAFAQSTYGWNVDANGNWNAPANWTPNTGFPNAIGDTANITNDITGNRIISVNAPITIGIMNVGDSNGSNTFTVQSSGGNSLTFDNTGTTAAQLNKLNLLTTTISVPLILNDRLVVSNSQSAAGNVNVLLLSGTISGNGGMTFSTEQASGAAVASTGAGSFTSSNLQLAAATSYTGSTILEKGALTINAGGNSAGVGLQGTSSLVFQGGDVVLRNGSTGTDNNRINDSASFVSTTGGTFVYRTSSAAYTASESVGALDLQGGTYTFRTMTDTPASGLSVTFTHSDLVRTGGSNTSFANFGSGSGASSFLGTGGSGGGTGFRLLFTNINGVAATNTAFLGGWATYGNYTGFAAYDTTSGVIQAATSNLANSSDSASTNFLMNGATLSLTAGNKSYNSLAFRAAASDLNLSGNTVSLVSGGLTFGNATTGAVITTHVLQNGFLQVGNTAGADTLYLSVGAQSTTRATISAVIQDNGSDVLTVAKGGPGEAVFNAAMTYSGGTYIESGTLILGAAGSIANGNVTIRENGSFQMLGGSQINFNIIDGTNADLFVQEAGSSFTLAGTMALDFSTATNGTWDLYNLASGSADGFSTISVTGAFSGSLTETAGVWTGVISGRDFTFTEATGILEVVPEPGTVGLLTVGLMATLFVRRRRVG